MSRFNDSKLVGSSKRLLALFLSALSFGGAVTHGVNNRVFSISNNSGNQNDGSFCPTGMAVNNPRCGDLLHRIGHLREMDREELVQIFESDFSHIVLRDRENINRFGLVDARRELMRNMIRFYSQLLPGRGPHFMNLLWAGSLFILLNEGYNGIENMKADFRNWNRNNISVNELHNYFVQKTEQQ